VATFQELPISSEIERALKDMGFEEATPIQAQTIPFAMEGRDLIGQAQTGTGKTAAFGVPLLEKVDTRNPNIQAIVLAPTRELAMQVAEELNRIGVHKGVHVLPVYGGQDMARQIRAIRNRPHVVVGTPGRMLDHIRRKTIRLDKVSFAVLDEADEMLNMGFIDDVRSILAELPSIRQTMLFSATMPNAIRQLADSFLTEPITVSITPKEVTVPQIEQHYIELPERQKFDVLCRLLDTEAPELSIIFGRTKRRVDELSDALIKRGYSADGLHGDLSQKQRDMVMAKFREGAVELLVATDVAARGLDVSGVTHVFNFDVPQDPESYVHRIGRTGRAGREGMSITFVTPREVQQIHIIERVAKRKIPKMPIPTLTEAFEGVQRAAVEKLMSIVQEGSFSDYHKVAEQLLEDNDSVTLVAASLKLVARESAGPMIELTEEKSIRVKRMVQGDRGRSHNDSGRPKGGYGRPATGRHDNRTSGGGRRNDYARDNRRDKPLAEQREKRPGKWDNNFNR